ncbi:mitochondrial glycoprotein [Xylogone sp. PMI_703]|nr:mitochondrial glycoprotein [Xylogone sp. PMI_703]
MFSVRSFTRSAPRTVSRLASSTIRRPAARSTPFLQSVWKPSHTRYTAAFSTSVSHKKPAGETDLDLVAKLQSEIEIETELKEADEVPISIKDFLENGPFEISDIPGQEDVVLTREFGQETIKITFSIADLNNIDPEADYADRAMEDDDFESGNINQDSKNFRQAPEDSIEAEEAEDISESFPARLNIVIEKSGKGALSVEAVAQDGMIIVDNVYYYTDPAHAYAKTADKVREREDLYVGPPFGNLDEDLQVLLEKYLDERGINTALALFVPDYIDMKEQKEYMRWLSNMKTFIEA